MKPRAPLTQDSALECAVAFLDVIPVIMGSLHCELRRDPATVLTHGQLRTLVFLDRFTAASLSQIADFLGLGLPATSKIVEGLVAGGTISRRVDPEDRRRVVLELSPLGSKELHAARGLCEKHLAKMLAPLAPSERERVVEAMHALRALFPKFDPVFCG